MKHTVSSGWSDSDRKEWTMPPRLGVTERLARMSAAHPRRTVAVWGLLVVIALGLVATSLHGLSSNAHVIGTPDSARAADLLARAFPPTSAERRQRVSDVIVVSSSRYPVSAPAFRREVAGLVAGAQATGRVSNVTSYLSGAPGLVAAGRHAALIQLYAPTDASVKPVTALAQR